MLQSGSKFASNMYIIKTASQTIQSNVQSQTSKKLNILLMEEILHQLLYNWQLSFAHYLQGFYTSQVVVNGISEPSTVPTPQTGDAAPATKRCCGTSYFTLSRFIDLRSGWRLMGVKCWNTRVAFVYNIHQKLNGTLPTDP